MSTSPAPEPAPLPRPSLETLLGRAVRLSCPRCGKSRLFRRWFSMYPQCPNCGLTFEKPHGYYLGSIYLNYGITAAVLFVLYVTLHFGVGWTNRQLALPLGAFCVVFPLIVFRFARAFWLAMDCHIDRSVLEE